jgi:kynurenine formamidase
MLTIDQSKYRLIDISWKVIPGANPDRPFDMKKGILQDNSLKYDIYNTHTHVGSHVEASIHFFEKDGRSIDEYDLSAFHGRGILLDVDLPDDQKYITGSYIESRINDILQEGDIVICRNLKYNDLKDKKYMTESAAWYFHRKKVKMIAFGKNVSLGDSITSGRLFHDILMRETTFLEFIDHTEEIMKKEFYVFALPILVKGLDSSWCRAIVIEDK